MVHSQLYVLDQEGDPDTTADTLRSFSFGPDSRLDEAGGQFQTREGALALTRADRDQGIKNELDFLSIPTFEAIAAAWAALLPH